jgi:lipoyl(octanoyl) transferase
MELDILDTGAHSGDWNMRFDVARAEALQAGAGRPLLRLYRWAPWCISLGRHQDEADLDASAVRAAGHDIVRRPTGGRAILHAEELTYSVVIPSEGRGVMEVYRHISEALAEGLRMLVPGIEMAKSQPDFQKLYREPGSIPCFSSSARYEIEYEGRKLVGSAQRRFGGAVLQHGSILIGAAHLELSSMLALPDEQRAMIRQDMERHTVTLNEILGREARAEEVAECLAQGFQTAWGCRLRLCDENAYIPST